MADTDPQSLLAVAKCFQCYGANDYSLLLMKLSLLRQTLLAVNPMADTTPQALLADAKCFMCYSTSPYMLQLMELALLKQIVDAGGGGSVRHGSGVPVGSLPGTVTIQYTNDDTGIQYTLTGGNWI